MITWSAAIGLEQLASTRWNSGPTGSALCLVSCHFKLSWQNELAEATWPKLPALATKKRGAAVTLLDTYKRCSVKIIVRKI